MLCDYFAVLRHGKAANNDAESRHKKGESNAYCDVVKRPSALHDLTTQGIREGKMAGDWLRRHGLVFDQHVVSSYLRALHTAALLDIENAAWEIEDRICEKDGGTLNAMTPEQVAAHLNDSKQRRHTRDVYRYRPERGESFLDLDARVRSFTESIRKRALIVCHGHVIRIIDRVIMAGQCSWEFGAFQDVRGDLPNCVFIEYRRIGNDWERRMSLPCRDPGIGSWLTIVRPKHKTADLLTMIEKIRTL